MQDAITNVINKSDVQGLYLDTASMSSLESYFASGELRVRAAATISANASAIIRDAVAKALLASYERKMVEVQEQADRIVAQAKESAAEAADQAKVDLAASIERRVQAAADQISSAETRAVKQVRDEAARIAIAAAGDVAAKSMSDAKSAQLIDDAIGAVRSKLH